MTQPPDSPTPHDGVEQSSHPEHGSPGEHAAEESRQADQDVAAALSEQADAKSADARAARRWGTAQVLALAVAGTFGILGGLGTFTFGYGEGAAYLTNDPAACANCHIMQPQYDAWLNSSHKAVATCNDCHLPHDFAGKWIVKADNGFFHSLAFTTGIFHEPIQIKPRNRRVTQNACLYCHGEFVHNMFPVEQGGDMLLCIHCHQDVGHAQR